MKATSSRRTAVLNAVFTSLVGLGILTSLLGIGGDVLLGSKPGFNLPQLLLTAAGLALVLVAFALRPVAVHARGGAKYGSRILAIAAMTLIALELALAAAGAPIYFSPDPDDIPEPFFEPAPWWTCDEAGCHYVHGHIAAACKRGQLAFDRECLVNQQGFYDSQDFVAGDDFDTRSRILALGDSFTFGESAEIGKSYVETIESDFPQSIVWNTGIPSNGTKQTLAAFQVYAPILQPQLTILGFYMNDFLNNMVPVDYWQRVIDRESGKGFHAQQYQVDLSGNVIRFDLRTLYYHIHNRVEPPNSEIERLIGRTRLGSLLPRFLNARRWRNVSTPQGPSISQSVDITRGYLKALRDAAAAQDTALLVLLIPLREDLSPPPRPYYQAARQLFEELAMPYLNPIHLLDAERDYMPKPDTHWNTAGHQKIGKLLSACLAVFQISGDLSDCEQVEMPSSGIR